MTAFKTAVIILVIITIVLEIIFLWCITRIKEDVDVMRHEYIYMMKEINEDSKYHLKEWGIALEKWQETVDLNNELLSLLKGGQDEADYRKE